jgi:hypothetical protein
LTVSLPPKPAPLLADPLRLVQVLTNLPANAAKFTDPGGHIRRTAEREAGQVVVRVRAPGYGRCSNRPGRMGVDMTRRVYIRTLALVALVGILIACPNTARAHEKWFYDATPYQARWERAFQFPGILGVGAAVTLTALAGLAWRARRGRDLIPGPEALGATESGRAQFFAVVPLILGIHVGLPLLVLAIKGEVFSPNNHLHGAGIYWLGVVQIGREFSAQPRA